MPAQLGFHWGMCYLSDSKVAYAAGDQASGALGSCLEFQTPMRQPGHQAYVTISAYHMQCTVAAGEGGHMRAVGAGRADWPDAWICDATAAELWEGV